MVIGKVSQIGAANGSRKGWALCTWRSPSFMRCDVIVAGVTGGPIFRQPVAIRGMRRADCASGSPHHGQILGDRPAGHNFVFLRSCAACHPAQSVIRSLVVFGELAGPPKPVRTMRSASSAVVRRDPGYLSALDETRGTSGPAPLQSGIDGLVSCCHLKCVHLMSRYHC